MGLPDGDGVALARDLVKLPWRPGVVMTSVDGDAVSAEEVHAAGADGFAQKDEVPEAGGRLLLASGGRAQTE
jgi:DNA-binding NarL/FixJ family response regulator